MANILHYHKKAQHSGDRCGITMYSLDRCGITLYSLRDMGGGGGGGASYLFRIIIWTSYVSPFLQYRTKINRVQRDLNLSYLIVLGKSVEIVYGKDQRLRTVFSERNILKIFKVILMLHRVIFCKQKYVYMYQL